MASLSLTPTLRHGDRERQQDLVQQHQQHQSDDADCDRNDSGASNRHCVPPGRDPAVRLLRLGREDGLPVPLHFNYGPSIHRRGIEGVVEMADLRLGVTAYLGAESSMTVPQWALLGFAVWTLLVLFGTVGVCRIVERILTGRVRISEWQADLPGR